MAATPAAPFSVDGKTAIVTGAGSGINFEFAQLLLSRNCNVVIGDLALRKEAQELVDAHQNTPRAVFHKTDVTDWGQLQALFSKAASDFGTVDIVCPGAGIFEEHFSNFWYPPGTSDSPSRDPIDGLGSYKTLDINLTHPIRATQLAIAEFLNPSNGAPKANPFNPKRVVHISSIAGQTTSASVPLYIASKHGLSGFIRSVGKIESNTGIRVNGVAPGLVKTPLWTDHPEKLKMVDEDRDEWVTPREVAEAMLQCVEDPELSGGTIYEVGAGQTRVVPEFGNKGPSGRGHFTSNHAALTKELYERLSLDGWGKTVGK